MSEFQQKLGMSLAAVTAEIHLCGRECFTTLHYMVFPVSPIDFVIYDIIVLFWTDDNFVILIHIFNI